MRPHTGDAVELPQIASQEAAEEQMPISSYSDSGEETAIPSFDSGEVYSQGSSTVDDELPKYYSLETERLARELGLFEEESSDTDSMDSVTGGHLDASPDGAAEEDDHQFKKQGHDLPGGGSDEREASQNIGYNQEDAEEAKARRRRAPNGINAQERPQRSSPVADRINAAGVGGKLDGGVGTVPKNPRLKSISLTPDVVDAVGNLFALFWAMHSRPRRESTDVAADEHDHGFKKQDHDVSATHHASVYADGSNEETVQHVSPKKGKDTIGDHQSIHPVLSGKGNDDCKAPVPEINLPVPEEGDFTGKPELQSWSPGSSNIRIDESPKKRMSGTNEAAITDLNFAVHAEEGDSTRTPEEANQLKSEDVCLEANGDLDL